MQWLVLGLVLFLGAHSVRIVAEGWRTHTIDRMGLLPWKGVYSLISVAGFVLLVWGYGQARLEPVVLWQPPVATRHVAGLLNLVAFIFMAAAYVPGNGIKARLRHPMILGVKVWALAHLLANGNLADVILFGSFLVWAILDFRSARQRDRAAGVSGASGSVAGTLVAVVVGTVVWAVFAFKAHAWLIGVSPFGV
ncbi:MAG: NnrU family protein [Aquabacterium sp.]